MFFKVKLLTMESLVKEQQQNNSGSNSFIFNHLLFIQTWFLFIQSSTVCILRGFNQEYSHPNFSYSSMYCQETVTHQASIDCRHQLRPIVPLCWISYVCKCSIVQAACELSSSFVSGHPTLCVFLVSVSFLSWNCGSSGYI